MKYIHWYYKFLILFLFFFSMFFMFHSSISNLINNSDYKYYIDSIFVPIASLKRGIIFNYKDVVKDNNKLKKEVLHDKTLLNENKSLKEEIDNIKKIMSIKNTYTGYNVVYAKTIIRNKMYWYNTITIDKGSKNGIKKNQAVVGINGLIGVISNVTNKTSSIKLITSTSTTFKISGMVKDKKNILVGLIEDYEYPYIKVSLATDSKEIKIGDKFYSYGLNNFPKNIYIGEVKKIQRDNYDLGCILYVEPKQDMNDINYVAVLTN